MPPANGSFDFKKFFAPIADEFEALDLAGHVTTAGDAIEVASNWKTIIEGGIEAYHLKVAHRDTIGPFFEDNLSSYRTEGDHMRSILPRVTMADLPANKRDDWHVRDHANVLYGLFPTATFLVRQDHAAAILAHPIAADKTILRIATLVPTE